MIKDLGAENSSHGDILVQKINQVVLKQVGVDIGVLILHNIVDHEVNRSNLIVSKGNIDG